MSLKSGIRDREYDKFAESSEGDTVVRVLSKDDGNILTGVVWDYTALTQDTTTDTWTFKSGGSGGTTTAVILITYTDSTKETISTVERTT